MIFKDAKEMHEYLMNSGDLYNKRTGHYVFEYNDAHAICVYSIPSYDEMLKTAKKALKQDESLISAVLGEGGVIYDDYSHDGYSEDENERALYLKPTMGYCHSYFTSQNWIDVREFFTHIQIEEIENLSENAQDGTDADTILADAVNNCEREFTGFAQDIFNIWKESSDKKAVEQMFFEFTDMEFGDYLKECAETITEFKGHEYVLSADHDEQVELMTHLSRNGYKTHFDEKGLLIVPETERHEVDTILEDRFISSCKRGPIRQLDITKAGIRCCDDLIVENGKINVIYELLFDADAYFGWETRFHDGVWINFYTEWSPDGTITASYTVDGDLYFHDSWELTKDEKDFFRYKMERYCQEKCDKTLRELYGRIAKEDIKEIITSYLVNRKYPVSPQIISAIYAFLEKFGLDIHSEDYAIFADDALRSFDNDVFVLAYLDSIVFEEATETAHESSFYYLTFAKFLDKLVPAKQYSDAENMGIRIDFPLGEFDVSKASVSVSPIRHNKEEDIWESYDWTDILLNEVTVGEIIKIK